MDDETRENLKKPGSAPAVPKELLSARPAMTKVKPKVPDAAAEASKTVEPPQPTEEELAERQERIDYLKNLRQNKKQGKKGGKKWLIALLIIVLLAAAGAGAYLLLKKPKVSQNSPKAATTAQTNSPAGNSDQADLKTYDSTNFTLSFKYPVDWTIADTAQQLSAISPKTTLTTASGAAKSVGVVLRIRPQVTSIAEFKEGNAAAVLDSKNVSYSAPATGQRGNTYLSYLQYAGTTTHGALDSIYITGNAGYQKGQNVPQADVIKVNPLINVSFVDCSAACTPASPAVSLSASDWAGNAISTTVETIIRSLTIN